MLLDPCQRPYCGGWMKKILNSKNEVEEICSKCAWPPNPKIERAVIRGILRHVELDRLFKAMMCQKTKTWREKKRQNIQKEVRV